MNVVAAAVPEASWDAVYLSPHLDDAVLSCGGQIWLRVQEGERVLVATVGTADEPEDPGDLTKLARTLHRAWRIPGSVVAGRRAEDEAACRLLGAEWLHLGLPEAIYRRHPETDDPLYPGFEALFGPLHPAEAGEVRKLAERLERLPPAVEVFAPLGAGGHVDHRWTRLAAEERFAGSLTYYEELPYATDTDSLDAALGVRDAWREEVIPLSRDASTVKLKAVAAYRSQLKPLFGGPLLMRWKLRRMTARAGGERVWKRRAPQPASQGAR